MDDNQDIDISKRTLVVLVLLTCTVSIIGTIALVYEFSTIEPGRVMVDNTQNTAEVKLNIRGAEAVMENEEPSPPPVGMATFEIREE